MDHVSKPIGETLEAIRRRRIENMTADDVLSVAHEALAALVLGADRAQPWPAQTAEELGGVDLLRAVRDRLREGG